MRKAHLFLSKLQDIEDEAEKAIMKIIKRNSSEEDYKIILQDDKTNDSVEIWMSKSQNGGFDLWFKTKSKTSMARNFNTNFVLDILEALEEEFVKE